MLCRCGNQDGSLTTLTQLIVVISIILSYSIQVFAVKKTVCIIGGGAAGYFSATECARVLRVVSNTDVGLDVKVVVLEASSAVLSKVLISGGGRCNVMHNPLKGTNQIAKGYPRGSKELLGPFNVQFGPWDTYEWFTKRNVELKTEADGRYFL